MAKKKSPLERSFRTNHVIPFLKTLPKTAVFPVQQSSIRGTPDFLLCVNGRFLGLELKRSDHDHPTKLQEYVGDCIKRSNGFYLVASPQGWDETKKTLKSLSEEPYAD